jgi:hypothetical protein
MCGCAPADARSACVAEHDHGRLVELCHHRSMRAEIGGKLSMSSPSAQDRLEDTLTDGAFSTLRYLPREVLETWLRSVLDPRFHAEVTPATLASAKFDFWPTLPGSVEPDVTIRVGALMVVIEAKYQSGFHQIGRRHQLTAQWEAARRVAQADGLEGPIVVAITDDVAQPSGIDEARAQVESFRALPAGGRVEELIRWSSWQELAKIIQSANTSGWLPGHFAARDDLFDLMKRRKVRYMYEGFKKADWWVLAAAADAASERVYPTIAEFTRELTQLGGPRGLIWGGNDSGVVWYESKQVAAAPDWHRNYIQLPMLHKDFGKRLQHYCALYVLFTFRNPSIRAGWWFQLPKGKLSDGQGREVASWLTTQPDVFDVLLNTPWQQAAQPVDRDQISADWVRSVLTARGGWLRLERAWSPEQVTSTMQVLDVLDGISSSLLSDGTILDSLNDNGVLDRTHTGAAPAIEEPTDDCDTDVQDHPQEQS